MKEKEIPIFVDLDETLIKTDIFWELLIYFIKQHPLKLYLLPVWLLRGRSVLKAELTNHVAIDVTVLPYNQQIINFLKKEKKKGRKLILASASPKKVVKKIAKYLNLFSDVIASDKKHNIKSRKKLEAIQEYNKNKPFGYIGDCGADVPIWKAANNVYVVTRWKLFAKKMKQQFRDAVVFLEKTSIVTTLKALRPHQWIKNTLVFLPFFFAHKSLSITSLVDMLSAFFAISFCASSVYLINDIFDVEADRHHPEKKHRAFASGKLPIWSGFIMAFGCLIVSLGLGLAFLSLPFILLLAGYFLFTFVYTFFIKKKMVLDVLGLSFFYVFRIFAGGIATATPLSHWFLVTSAFFFLNLAFVKRYIELHDMLDKKQTTLKGRNYEKTDMQILPSAGLASGYLSTLVFFLYIANSEAVQLYYHKPVFLWFIGPILIYWITRLWILANRKLVNCDPVLYAIKDPVSWVMAAVAVVLVFLGSI